MSHQHTVVEHEGQILGYNQDDVESIDFETPRDIVERVEDGHVLRSPGTAHLNVRITFKEGCAAQWKNKEE